MRKFVVVCLGSWLVCGMGKLHAQPQIPSYPQAQFYFPLKPGKKNFLSGNFGELRPNHFHAGIDIKSDYKTGLPVYAADGGYVSKIVVSSFGYGYYLQLTHPNGFITLYAHLQKFNYAIQKYVREQQYKKESFEVELYPEKGRLRVEKGQLIAYSGNTGSSGGPHLHFEIRDTNNKVYNPLYFGFEEVKDDVPPIITKIAFRPFTINSRINGEFTRGEFAVKKRKKTYILPDKVYLDGLTGLEISTNDKQPGTSHLNGISCIEVFLDGKEIFNYHMDKFSIEETHNINAHIDYETMKRRGSFFQKCYLGDGNKLPNYKNTLSGKFTLPNDGVVRNLKINVYDAYQNKSTLEAEVVGGIPEPFKPSVNYKLPIQHDHLENFVKVTVRDQEEEGHPGTFYCGKKLVTVPFAYAWKGYKVFLWDLRQALPDSFHINNLSERFRFTEPVYSNTVHKNTYGYMDVHFPKNSIFDTLYLKMNPEIEVQKDSTLAFEINDQYFPLSSHVFLSVNTLGYVTKPVQTAAYAQAGKGLRYLGGTWHGHTLHFKTKSLGKFIIKKDILPPTVRWVKRKRTGVQCIVKDYPSGIKGYRATLNGKWILMYYEHKKNLLYTDPDIANISLQGELQIDVSDNAGNTLITKTTIK